MLRKNDLVLISVSHVTSHWVRNNMSNFQGAVYVKIAVKDGKIRNQVMMRNRHDRFDEVIIVDETDGYGLDDVEKAKKGCKSTTSNMGIIP